MLFPNPKAEQVQAEAEPAVEPVEVTQDIINEMFGDTAAPATQEPAEAEPEESEPEEEVVQTRQTTPEQMLYQLVPAIVQATIAQTQKGNQAPAPDVVDQLAAQLPGADRQGLEVLVKTVQTAMAQNPVTSKVEELSGRQQQLENIVRQQAQQGVLQDFDKHMDKLLDQAKVTDTTEREMIYNTVIHRGAKQYGQQFDKDKASLVFRRLNSERTRSTHQQQQKYVETKQEEAASEPPIRHGKAPGAASESVMRELQNPQNKSFSFNGKNFNRLVKGLIKSGLGG